LSQRISVLFSLLMTNVILGQSVSDYAYTGVSGSASVGTMAPTTGGIHSLFHNPATLSEVSDKVLNVGTAELYGIPYTHAGWIQSFKGLGVIGVSTEISKVTFEKVELSTEQRIGISHGFNLQKDKNSTLALGVTLNHFSWILGHSAGTAGDGSDGIPGGMSNSWGLDVGVIGSLRDKHRVGAMIKNAVSSTIGSGGTEQSLPKRLSAGVSYTPFKGLMTSFLFERALGKDIQIKGSIHFDVSPSIHIIAGVQSNPNRLGIGGFLSVSKIKIGYALLTHPVLPIVHQTGLIYNFSD